MKKILTAVAALTLLLSAGAAFNFDFNLEEAKAGYVDLSGTISATGPESAFDASGINPEEVRELNEQIEEQNYEAVIYEINSGGGTVVASKEVMDEIDSMDIPTICRMRDVAASGAYLAALGCDEVVADEGSMTGSIGVRSSYLEFSELLEQYGIEYINVSSGEFKGLGDPFQNTTEEDIAALEQQASQIHTQFLDLVQDRRGLTDQEVAEVGDGSIILGEDAKDKGLVDHLGRREVSEQLAENATDKSLEFERVETHESLDLFSLLTMDAMVSILASPFNDAPLTAEI